MNCRRGEVPEVKEGGRVDPAKRNVGFILDQSWLIYDRETDPGIFIEREKKDPALSKKCTRGGIGWN